MGDVQRKDEIQGEIVHVYDGIEEADNDLPFWWLVTFYGAVIFAVVYWFAIHEFAVWPTIADDYQAAVAAQLERFPPVTPEELAALEGDEAAIAAGQGVFAANCVACHKSQGEGDIGPNLTDGFWIHGGGITDVYRVVAEGVLDKGMPNWLPVLGPEAAKQVTAYVVSLRNTNVPGKEPQGDPWVDPNAAPEEAAADDAGIAGDASADAATADAAAPAADDGAEGATEEAQEQTDPAEATEGEGAGEGETAADDSEG